MRSAVPVPAWPAGRVTLLGDAIHAMSPARGSGANTALQDAADLCAAISRPPPGPAGSAALIAAIAGYEQQMRERGFAAVEASRRAEAQTAGRGNPWWLRLRGRLPAARGR